MVVINDDFYYYFYHYHYHHYYCYHYYYYYYYHYQYYYSYYFYDRAIAVQVVSAANIGGVGHGLEVGRKLELLSIRQAEAHAEQALRLQKGGQPISQRPTPGPASKLAAVAMQVHTLLLLLSLPLGYGLRS